MFPDIRLRRNRKANWLREMIAEKNLCSSDLILPIFVIEGENRREEISTMPGVYRLSIDNVINEVKKASTLGIKAVMLFPAIDVDLKSEDGSEAYNLDNLICRCIRALKQTTQDIGIMADVALDPYTSHGHDGILNDDEIDNDLTIEAIGKQALTLAKAGVDAIAPSDMMDGRVGYIRQMMDSEGFHSVNIISYAAKYNSSFLRAIS